MSWYIVLHKILFPTIENACKICTGSEKVQTSSYKIVMYTSSVQFSRSVVPDSLQPHGLQHASLPVYHQIPEFTQTHVHWVSDAIQLPCHPLLLLPSIFLSIRVFSNESALRIRWPKYWSFSFNISPSNEHSGLISFRMDWLDLLVISKLTYFLEQFLVHSKTERKEQRVSYMPYIRNT